MQTARPLAGLRVLELARVLAGPWAGQLMADLGADVIKIERTGMGDETRHWGPPFIGDTAAYYHATNRGKRGLALDFKSESDRAQVRALAAESDVLLENFKVGDLAKFGLDHAALSRDNPRLITCSITGFGQTGPYAHRAGYDFVVQAMSGFMSITGEAGGPPQKAGVAYADLFTGVYSVVAILAAVHERARTGRGAHIDMALLDTQIAVLANQAMNYFVTGRSPARQGNTHPNLVPYQVFAAADGDMVIAVGNDGQFAKLCQVLGTGFAGDPRFSTNPARVQNRQTLVPLLAALIAAQPRAALLDALEAAGVPAGPVNSMAEAFADLHVQHRQLRLDLEGGIPGLRSPIMMDGKPCAALSPSPPLDATQPEAAPRARAVTNTPTNTDAVSAVTEKPTGQSV